MVLRSFAIRYSKQEERKELKFGDFIRIRKSNQADSDINESGFLISEGNYAGFNPGIMYR